MYVLFAYLDPDGFRIADGIWIKPRCVCESGWQAMTVSRKRRLRFPASTKTIIFVGSYYKAQFRIYR